MTYSIERVEKKSCTVTICWQKDETLYFLLRMWHQYLMRFGASTPFFLSFQVRWWKKRGIGNYPNINPRDIQRILIQFRRIINVEWLRHKNKICIVGQTDKTFNINHNEWKKYLNKVKLNIFPFYCVNKSNQWFYWISTLNVNRMKQHLCFRCPDNCVR